MLHEFKKFIARGSVIDLAVAVIIGAAFGKIVNSLVEGVIMPPLGLVLGRVDFSSLFYTLDRSHGIPGSLVEARAKGIPVLAYGAFINDVVNFLIIAAVVFLLVRAVNRIDRRSTIPPPPQATKECPYCLSAIPPKATRCPHCTSHLAAAG